MSTTSVYPAEDTVFAKKMRGRDVGMSMRDSTELIHRYVPDYTVRRTSGAFAAAGWCNYKKKIISLPRDAGLPYVLHELAHALAREHGHGLAFQNAYIDLVAKEMSPWWARRLRASFIKHKTKGYKSL